MPANVLFGGVGIAIAGHSYEDGEGVRVISVLDMREKLDGHPAKATIVEVIIGPGENGLPHKHPGPGFVFVLEGEYELGIDEPGRC